MIILTSYFASRAPKERKVCIAKKPYRFAPNLYKAEALAPSNPWAEGDWKARYRADLDARFPTPGDLRLYLENLCALNPVPILCCYEKDPQECHRSVLAAYIREKLGITVAEWTPDPGGKKPVSSRKKPMPSGQLSLLSLF